MTEQQNKGAVEAILFASGEPVAADKIAEVLELTLPETEELLHQLMEEYNRPDRGIQIRMLDGEYQMCSNKAFGGEVRRVLELRRNTPLSPAALEVLAVIAYNQPVTKAFLEQVRGVDCSGVVGSLMTKGLIEERGRLELPGRPLLYGTTDAFLRTLNISSLSELPPLPKDEVNEESADEAGEDE